MKQKRLLLYLSLLVGMGLSAQSQDQARLTSVNLVKEASVENALSFLQLIPEGQEKEYGFESRADFSKIKIEDPFETYYMHYKENKLGFVSGNEWRVPLSVDGKFVALLTVVFNNGKAEVVDFGASVLAQKLQECEQRAIAGNQHVLIRSTYLSQDFVTPDFEALINAQEANGFRVLNMDSAQAIYQLNPGEPVAVSVSTLYTDTAAAMSNMAK